MGTKKSDKRPSPFLKQVGGSHYRVQGSQPFPFAMANDFNAYQWSVLKYITRITYEDVDKAREDLDKIIHYTEMYKELL